MARSNRILYIVIVDDDIKQYLSLGPDFCEITRRVPYERTIAETEKICSMIRREGEITQTDKEIIEPKIGEIREEVKVILEKARHKRYPSNLSKEETRGKYKAMEDQSTVFLSADKGRVMVNGQV